MQNRNQHCLLGEKNYCNTLGDNLWRNDVEIQCNGTTFTMIWAKFASNSWIEDTHSVYVSTLKDLRFKKANYKWIKHAYEWTYYDINSPADGELY